MDFLEVEHWRDRRAVLHGFGTRNSDAERLTRADWRGKTISKAGERIPLVSLRQVHGDEIIVVGGGKHDPDGLWEREGDALLTESPGIALAVFTADCLPIFLFEPQKRIAGVVHAGWRGTARGITRKTVEKMAETFSCGEEKIQAALGPCIGPCCYEVDGPVEARFREGGLPWETFASPRGPGKWSLDLLGANAHLLIKGGVKKENIRRLSFCTACRPDLFFSYRRERGTRGRHLNFISIL
jgi:hypothetical protein